MYHVFLYLKFPNAEMAEVKMTIFQKLKSITVPILFNILLPIFDVFSDVRLIIRLLLGGVICKQFSDLYDDYYTCQEDATNYCTNSTTNHDVCEMTTSGFRCRLEYFCWRDSITYALMLLVPLLLNYIVSFMTWWRYDMIPTRRYLSYLLF